MSRLIFVEGFPGAGKSTTAQFLSRRFARGGGRVRWIYEGEVPNPLVHSQPAGGDQSWEQFVDRRVARWRTFAAAAGDQDVTLIPESALLQLPVFTMLRRNVDPSLITALVARLVEAATPLRPTLVYLARRNPEAAFRAIGESRGLAWLLPHVANSAGYTFIQERGLSGLDGLLAYWRAHAEDETFPESAELARMAGRYRDGKREVTTRAWASGSPTRCYPSGTTSSTSNRGRYA